MKPSARSAARHVRATAFALLLSLAACAPGSAAHADPGDFQAMPGLWKITLRTVTNGHAAPAQVKWKCLYDGGDPWATFVDAMAPDAGCRRSDEHRASTALAWQVHCGARPGRGRIALDSSQHYTGNVTLDAHEVLRIEGARVAACTSPSD
ncbi:hypothetical protein [Rhodanobacter sp. DHB23]|uniref:DUF3617 domain-containing protein n=1 Tax=Rhodanobacter sp. DHB23 TaxID=2775923 RepID=UPI00177F9888|nr:hypothetical protein [Rhodanobacter sp. DHB23]MBD8873941.1 hypothetical protein [Rhodanobacter sp. DHB23]